MTRSELANRIVELTGASPEKVVALIDYDPYWVLDMLDSPDPVVSLLCALEDEE